MNVKDNAVNNSEIELIEKAKVDNAALETLLKNYDAYLSKLVKGFTIVGYQREDLMQEARAAFCSAVKAYTPNKGIKFPTFAAVCVNNRLGDILKGTLTDKRNGATYSIDDESVFLELVSDELGPEDKILENEFREEFEENVKESLTDFEYRVMQLFLEGYKYKDILERLTPIYPKTTIKSIDNALTRVKNKLKELL